MWLSPDGPSMLKTKELRRDVLGKEKFRLLFLLVKGEVNLLLCMILRTL